jgi:Predicted transcriptional regulator
MTKSLKRIPAKEEIFAEEDLVIDVQFLLQELLNDKQINRAQLASMTGLSRARLSQLMRSDANPTLRTLARVFHALGEELFVTTKKRRDDAAKLLKADAPPWTSVANDGVWEHFSEVDTGWVRRYAADTIVDMDDVPPAAGSTTVLEAA